MSICETTINYNGITLKNVLTETVDIKPVFDTTGVQFIGMRTTVTCIVMAHVSGDYGDTHLHGVNVKFLAAGGQLGPGLTALARKLVQPRRPFLMQVGGQTMFYILPSATEPGLCNPTAPADKYTLNVDIEHGPKVDMQILAIMGDKAARCRMSFSFVTPVCDNPSAIQDFVSLRYWIADDIDCKTWLTVRRYQGVFRVKGLNVDPHVLARTITIPTIQRGFRRDTILWSQDPDGLNFHFDITDVEQWAQAPKPATHFSGTFSLSIPQADITHTTELRFTLKAAKELRFAGDEKLALMKLAQNIIEAKLHFAEQMKDTTIIVESQVWEERLEDAEINVYMKLRHTGEVSLTGNLMQIGKWFEFGKPLDTRTSVFNADAVIGSRDYDKEVAYIPELGPSAGLKGIFLCALSTPCCPQVMTRTTTEEEPEPEEEDPEYIEYPPPVYIAYSEDEMTRYSDHHRKAPYLSYVMSSDFDRDTGWRAFPKGSPGTSIAEADTFAFSQICRNVSIREVRIEAERVNEWPVLPDMRDSWIDPFTGIRYVLRNSKVSPTPPRLSADGKHDVRSVYAVYYYYMSRPLRGSEHYLAGNLPYVDLTKTVEWSSPEDLHGMPPTAFFDPSRLLGNDITPIYEDQGTV